MELLRLFGVPYVEAPSEAEAQCAALELLGLVDGVVTDDSDVWLFGATEVYKNIFNEQKYVELYRARDVIQELGLQREDYVCLALLLGSDYTTGVHGIGTYFNPFSIHHCQHVCMVESLRCIDNIDSFFIFLFA